MKLKNLFYLLIALGFIGLVVYGFLPKPIEVDLAQISRGPLRVTVDEDGKTRIRERYVVSTPIAGRLSRITLRSGDAVIAGETLLAVIEPANPALLDARARTEAAARVKGAEAARSLAIANLEQARSVSAFAKSELSRAQKLFQSQNLSQKDMDDAEHKEKSASEGLKAAEFSLKIQEFELEQAQAALLTTRPGDAATADTLRFEIRSPISGRALRVFQESAMTVTPGMQLLELGDPADLEVEIDVLSSDAVKIQPGARVSLERWGGDAPLNGSVRLVEPAAFTKISALGVEEQRVNILARIDDPRTDWQALGDAYRVEARIVIWEAESVLKAPSGALFRQAENWATFVSENGNARLALVKVGHSNGIETEILEGVTEGASVIVHPSDQVRAGVEIIEREK